MASLSTAVGFETLTWEFPTRAGYSLADQRAAIRQSGDYQAAVTAAIADLQVSLPSGALADAEDASREITRFDSELGGEIAPFASVLLRSESAASSNIENLTASARAVAEAEVLGDGSRRNAAIIVANTAAMQAAINLADRIDAEAILDMHRALMRTGRPAMAGKWRDEQVWIGAGMFGPRGADYIAPHHDRVPGAVDDLILFAKRADIPALPQIAIAHAQFEAIHPFPDGNGRTGRALVQAMLRNKDMTRHVTVPVSAGLLTNTGAYFDALTAYRRGEPEFIVGTMSEAAILAVANGRRLVADLRGIRAEWKQRITARRDSAVHRVVDFLLKRPVFNATLLHRELGITTGNARRYIDPLVEAGIMVEFTDRSRNRAWRAPEILAALDAFGERSGRRRRPSCRESTRTGPDGTGRAP